MQTLIQVLDSKSRDVLAEYHANESEKAYTYATFLEKSGLEVEITFPSITDTLAHELGVRGEEQTEYEQSVQEELCGHDGISCDEAPSV